MSEPLPTLLIPGLMATPELYAPQLPALWQFGPVIVADHRRDDSMSGIAARVLAEAPPHFRLIGLSMGGYIAFEIMRQAGERVAALALLDTSARPDTDEQTKGRHEQIAMADREGMGPVAEMLFPRLVAEARHSDAGLKQTVVGMATDTGADAFARQQRAIMGRADSRPSLAAIRCPTLVLVGTEDKVTPAVVAEEIAGGVSGARLVTVPGSGHLSTIERPDEVTRELVAHWSANE